LTHPNYATPNLTLFPDNVGPRKIRVLMPGELRQPGTVAGKSGTPVGPASDNHFTAGKAVSVTIDGTDTWGNILNLSSTTVFTTDDPYDAPDPRLVPLINGTSVFTHI